MRSIISKIALTAAVVAAVTLNVQAGTVYQKMKSDTNKMKMDKMKKMDKMGKMDKKMSKPAAKKMMKDTGKMSKM